jgi:DNA-binding CsgD family transcriptional regulator
MQHLPLSDVEQMIHLLACAGDPTADASVNERKQVLLNGVAELINADFWMWSTFRCNPRVPGDAMTVGLIDGGWNDDQERVRFYEVLTNPKLRAISARMLDPHDEQMITHSLDRFVSAEDWRIAAPIWHGAGFDQLLVARYALGQDAFSAVGYYRRVGRPAFTERDRVVVHVIFQQVDWLHRHGSDVPAGEHVLRLSPRERQVLVLLLGGDSRKEVAHKLRLSEHTVGDYLKKIYKHFAVSSRAELLAYFIAGGQN